MSKEHRFLPAQPHPNASLVSATGDENPIKLSVLPRYIPSARDGKKRHVSSIYRYVLRGVRGIRLEVRRYPDGLYTSLAAWDRFVARLTEAGSGANALPRPIARVPANRQRAIEEQINAVRKSIRKKLGRRERNMDAFSLNDAKPRWDAQRGEFWFGGRLCKRFRQQAQNQRLVLAAFEEECWPNRIDDPLPPDPEVDHRQRLADTVRRLNDNPLIRFELDGTGEGILYAARADNALSSEA